MNVTRGVFRLLARTRSVARVPVDQKSQLSSDSAVVERRLLVADLGYQVAQDLLYYPPDVAMDALSKARALLKPERPSVSTTPARLDPPQEDAPSRGLGKRGLHLIAACFLLVVFAMLVFALKSARADDIRADFYKKDGRRNGYAVIDPKTGRFDTYDTDSRRTGWGRVRPGSESSRTSSDWYSLSGQRIDPRIPPSTRPRR